MRHELDPVPEHKYVTDSSSIQDTIQIDFRLFSMIPKNEKHRTRHFVDMTNDVAASLGE